MKLIPDSISRTGYRAVLKLSAASPTVLVVAGVIGLGATAVLAAKATRKLDPIIEDHQKARVQIDEHMYANEKARTKDVIRLYVRTGSSLGRLYGPTVFIGTTSAIAVLGGHKILRGRQIATLAAYSGLTEQFANYRNRVIQTLGEDVEQAIYEGAHGEWVEDPNHKGEYKLTPKFDPEYNGDAYLRPWFDKNTVAWTGDPSSDYMYLKGMQSHMNNILQIRGHVFLNDVYDALRLPRTREGQAAGWLWKSPTGDNYVDFGFMGSTDPHTRDFCEGRVDTVRLHFNIDGPIWNKI